MIGTQGEKQERRPQDDQATLQADIQAAIAQLKVWAEANTVIRYESGSLLTGINFCGRLRSGMADSFWVAGAPEYGAAGMSGQIQPEFAEYVRVEQTENYMAVILRRMDGASCIVFEERGPRAELLRARSLSDRAQ